MGKTVVSPVTICTLQRHTVDNGCRDELIIEMFWLQRSAAKDGWTQAHPDNQQYYVMADTRLVNKYNIFVLEVLKAWTDPAQKYPKTIHHRGYGKFAVDGEIIKPKSREP
jgi:hypothetical protein